MTSAKTNTTLGETITTSAKKRQFQHSRDDIFNRNDHSFIKSVDNSIRNDHDFSTTDHNFSRDDYNFNKTTTTPGNYDNFSRNDYNFSKKTTTLAQ